MLFFGMIVGGVDIGYQIYRKVTLGPDYNVAISAHIGGLICGMFCLLQLPSLGTTSLHSLSLSLLFCFTQQRQSMEHIGIER